VDRRDDAGSRSPRPRLEARGFTVEVPDAGCCGMAGPFGFQRDKLAVSVALAERVLAPAVRALHVAEVVARAMGL
jgi:Fe-S oxidoreductase